MDDKQAQFLPFHAINEFMRNDYRLAVVRRTLEALPGLPQELQAPVDRLTKRLVQVPGFRNSTKAPWPKRVRPTADAFEKSPQLVAAILSAWSASHPDLRQQVYELLTGRGWDVLPPDADRSKLPGFIAAWPKGEDFEKLNAAFAEKFPDVQGNSDDISLMVVWLSSRLPFPSEEEGEPGEADVQTSSSQANTTPAQAQTIDG